MIQRLLKYGRGEGVKSKAVRGTVFTIANTAGSNLIRLVSNLILTRLLFPEAFGIMALAQVFIYGLVTFSDVGIQTSIIQNKRGDEPRFLNTAWTIQVLRGILLWVGALIMAMPAAQIYEQPLLESILPFLALTLVIEGFKSTKEAQAIRHLNLERLTILTLSAQLVGLVLMVLVVYVVGSIWGLVFGTILTSFCKVLFISYGLKGHSSSWQWDKESADELIRFGKFIFLSTLCSFFLNISDRAILGGHIDAALFGIFTISYTLASIPGQFTKAIAQRVIFPLYRLKPAIDSVENQQNIFRMRRIVSSVAILMLFVMSIIGDWLVGLLYDPRYAIAGPMLILFAVRSVIFNASIGAKEVLNASGDSKRYFVLTAVSAITQIVFVYFGVVHFGVVGAIIAPGLTMLAIYPLQAYFVAKYKAWDPMGELAVMACGLVLTCIGCYLNWDGVSSLIAENL